MTDEKTDIDRKDSLRLGRLFFEGYLVCIYVWKKLSDHILWIQGLV